MSLKKFNIRVYGLLVNQHNEILVSDERRNGHVFTKFPGGGLEWGEGTIDCLKREFQEEIGIAVEVGDLFYATDFFQQSAFSDHDQLISIYYWVSYAEMETIGCLPKHATEDYEVVRWVKLTELSPEIMTFPIDKIVLNKLGSFLSLGSF